MKQEKQKPTTRNVLKKFGVGAMLTATMFCTGGLLSGCMADGKDGKDGTNAAAWYYGTYTPTLDNRPGQVGDYYIDQDDNKIYQLTDQGWKEVANFGAGTQGPAGQPGADGEDGVTPHIGANGNWYIGTQDTGIKAQGQNGENGQDGVTPHIGANGNWWIGTQDTGVKAQGKDGADGTNGTNGQDGVTPHIGANGNWYIGTQDTGYSAIGKDGKSATISIDDNGYFIVDGENTGFIAGSITNQQLYEKLSNIIEFDNGATFTKTYDSVKNYFLTDETMDNKWISISNLKGWGGYIGKPESINTIKFRLKARETAITKINVYLTEDGYDGTLVAEAEIDVDIQPNEWQDVLWTLNQPITNTEGKSYYLKFYTDTNIIPFGRTSDGFGFTFAMNEEDKAENRRMVYTNSSNVLNFRPATANYYTYLPVEIGEREGAFKLSEKVLERLKAELNVEEQLYSNSTLVLPKTIYGSVGQTMQIYLRNICAYPLDEVYFQVTGNGKLYTDRWEYTATKEENFNLTISLYSKNWKLISETTVNVVIKNPTKNTAKVLVLGDSTVDMNTETKQMLTLATGDENFSLELLGTRGKDDNKHEGRGGWNAKNYVENATRTSSQTGEEIVNPFYNPAKSKFDFSYYMTQQNYTDLDVVFIQLGINDIVGSTTENALKIAIDTFTENMQFMINSIHEYDANLKVVINLVIPCEQDQNKFTENYGTQQTVWGFMRNMFNINQNSLNKFNNINNVYLSWYNAAIDATTNMRGDVHPTDAGYSQLGTQMYYFLKSIV